MPYDLAGFSLSDMTRCGIWLRKIGREARSLEEVASRTVRYLRDELVDGRGGAPCCPLVRFYKTHPYGELDSDQRLFARAALGDQEPSPSMKCLTLIATAGEEPNWNARQRSAGHKAIPLASETIVTEAPMISQLIKQFGLEIGVLIRPSGELLMEAEQRTYNVFHVHKAPGSPHIPAQEGFVIPYGIQSVLGFGGLLPSAELFAVILFSRVTIPRERADLFKTLALNVKLAILPFADGPTFE